MTSDNLLGQWQEVNTRIRHCERLHFENARAAMAVITAFICAAALLLSLRGLDSTGQRSTVAALLFLASLLAILGCSQVLGAGRDLLHHLSMRSRLGGQAELIVGVDDDDLQRRRRSHRLSASMFVGIGALCYLGANAVLLLPQSLFVRTTAHEPMRVAVEGFSELTASGNRMARALDQAQSPRRPASGPLSIEGLAELTGSMHRLADGLLPLGSASSSPRASDAAGIPTQERMPFEAVAKESNSPATLYLAAISMVFAVAGVLVATLRISSPSTRAIVATSSLALGVTGTLPLSFKGEVNLKGDFSCGSGGCIRVQHVGSVFTALLPTPSFDIGAWNADAVAGCVGLRYANDAAAWAQWRASFKQQWLERKDPRATDVVLLRGSADPQRLSGPLRQRHETNGGLALARAEYVAGLLREDTSGLPRPQDRLDPTRILTIAAGPAGTGGAAPAAAGRPPCDDVISAQQRSVSVWIHGAAR
jgi:hypothetical protein